MSDYREQTLTCVDCEQGFTWNVEDQEYFHEQGFANEPKRCLPCRQAKRQRFGDADMNRGARK